MSLQLRILTPVGAAVKEAVISTITATMITADIQGRVSAHMSRMYCRNIHMLGSRPHTGAGGQCLVPVRRHLPKVGHLQHHPKAYLSQPVLVLEYELYQFLLLVRWHRILLQHTLSTYLSDTEHTIPHGIYGEIQVMTSAL